MAAPLSMSYFAKAQTEFKPPLIANENAFLGDVVSSEKNDPTAPISAGFYRLEKGEPSTIREPLLGFQQRILDWRMVVNEEEGHLSLTENPLLRHAAGVQVHLP